MKTNKVASVIPALGRAITYVQDERIHECYDALRRVADGDKTIDIKIHREGCAASLAEVAAGCRSRDNRPPSTGLAARWAVMHATNAARGGETAWAARELALESCADVAAAAAQDTWMLAHMRNHRPQSGWTMAAIKMALASPELADIRRAAREEEIFRQANDSAA